MERDDVAFCRADVIGVSLDAVGNRNASDHQAFVPGRLFSAISQPAVGSSIPWSAGRFFGVFLRGWVVVVVVF
jgi:hypothetical protein